MTRHELDRLLGGLSGAEEALPANRIRVAAASYQQEAGEPRILPPSDQDRPKIADWLQGGLETGIMRCLRPAVTERRLAVYPTWVDKARALQARRCDVCSVWAGPGTTVSFDVPIEPFSAQCSASDLRYYKQQISSYLKRNRMTAQGWSKQAVCITVVAILPQSKRLKDVDNLIKGFNDSFQEVLFENDHAIAHLEVFRLRPQVPDGCYLVTARPVRPMEDDIMDNSRDVRWKRRLPSPAQSL